MNIKLQGSNGLSIMNQPLMKNSGLKSTQQKMERQAKCNNQIAFYENQKENLKNMKCDSLEEISRKLEMLHTYEDEIAAVKAAYNSEQMYHIMDEAEEMGKKMAEAAEKMEPKTPEERREEAAKKAGDETAETTESEGLLEELLEDVGETLEEQMQEELGEEQAQEELREEQPPEELGEEQSLEDLREEQTEEELRRTSRETWKEPEWKNHYRPMDVRV